MELSVEVLVPFYYQAGATTFTRYQSFADYDLAMSDIVEGAHTNHILYRRGDPDEILAEVDTAFAQAKEVPTFYVSPLAESIEAFKSGWKALGCDVWMSLALPNTLEARALPEGVTVELVDPAAPEEYLQTFIEAFSDPDDVYGVISEGYVTSERNSFALDGFEHLTLICRQGSKAVGAVHAFIRDGLAYLCAFGVIKAYRRGGHVAYALGRALLDGLVKRGVSDAFLVTEKGSVLDRFYRKHGFCTLFEGQFWQKA